jgi:hypothetical protein
MQDGKHLFRCFKRLLGRVLEDTTDQGHILTVSFIFYSFPSVLSLLCSYVFLFDVPRSHLFFFGIDCIIYYLNRKYASLPRIAYYYNTLSIAARSCTHTHTHTHTRVCARVLTHTIHNILYIKYDIQSKCFWKWVYVYNSWNVPTLQYYYVIQVLLKRVYINVMHFIQYPV